MKYDKPEVQPEDVQEIARRYATGKISRVLYLGGVPNCTFKVEGDNVQLAIRICNNGYTSPEHLDLEFAILRHLAATDFTYSPRLIAARDGRVVHSWNGYRVFAMNFLSGARGDSVEITENLCQDVGRVTASLHASLASMGRSVPDTESFFIRGERLLDNLPEITLRAGWVVNINSLRQIWTSSASAFVRSSPATPQGFIHTDIWPPNVLCQDDTITGIVDFDDCSFGPIVLDMCAIMVEFPWFNTLEFDRDRASEVLNGYISAGGNVASLDSNLLIAGMKLACISWFGCNAVHGVGYEDSKIYEDKLHLLEHQDYADDLQAFFRQVIQDLAVRVDHHRTLDA